MFKIKKSNERGYFENKWLKSYHSFSFSTYYNPNQMNFSDLRVINEDLIQPEFGFDTHPHKNMEIFTYVLSGKLKHLDSMGNSSIIEKGDVQLMSAGYGVEHSEFNPSSYEPVKLLQIWINPYYKNTEPSYQQKNFSREDKLNKIKLLISPYGQDNSLIINQDVKVYSTILEQKNNIKHEIRQDRKIYIHIVKGDVLINNFRLFEGDAIEVVNENLLSIYSNLETELLIFDLKI